MKNPCGDMYILTMEKIIIQYEQNELDKHLVTL